MPKVYNLRDKHRIRIPRKAVYIGRGTPWGNPFIAGTHGSRERVIERFNNEVLPTLDVSALRSKDLVCWCDPLPCHGHLLLEKANRPLLPEGLYDGEDGRFYFECKACDAKTEWEGAPEDFEYGHYANVCGGSPWCLP